MVFPPPTLGKPSRAGDASCLLPLPKAHTACPSHWRFCLYHTKTPPFFTLPAVTTSLTLPASLVTHPIFTPTSSAISFSPLPPINTMERLYRCGRGAF